LILPELPYQPVEWALWGDGSQLTLKDAQLLLADLALLLDQRVYPGCALEMSKIEFGHKLLAKVAPMIYRLA
jgi:hypothetical protein